MVFEQSGIKGIKPYIGQFENKSSGVVHESCPILRAEGGLTLSDTSIQK